MRSFENNVHNLYSGSKKNNSRPFTMFMTNSRHFCDSTYWVWQIDRVQSVAISVRDAVLHT